MTSGKSTNEGVMIPKRNPPKFKDYLFGCALVASICVLAVVFFIALPSIESEPVHKSDKDVLEGVRRLATFAALASALSGAVLGILLRIMWTGTRGKLGGTKPPPVEKESVTSQHLTSG
jgi:hypothetical protein